MGKATLCFFRSLDARRVDRTKLIISQPKMMKSLVLLLLAAAVYAQVKTYVPLKRIESVREKLTR